MADAHDQFTVSCDRCGKRYVLGPSAIGKKANCKCGHSFVVAKPAENEEDAGGDYGLAEPSPPAAPAFPAAQPYPTAMPAYPAAAPVYPSAMPVNPVDAPAYPAPVSGSPAMPAAPHLPPPRTSGPGCQNHPQHAACAACARCRAFVCGQCDRPQPDGSHLCPTCAAAVPVNPYAVNAPWSSPSAGPCVNHPTQMGVVRCSKCQASVCATCDFPAPGGAHFCPRCATSGTTQFSSLRKTMATWSLVCSGGMVVLVVLLLSGIFVDLLEVPLISVLIERGPLIPGALALALGWGSLDGRRGNPTMVWVAVVISSLLYAAYTFLYLALLAYVASAGG